VQVWDAARARDHRFFQHIDKIDAGAQGIDIDEDLGFAEMRGEPVVHVSDVREGVVAPVADKDPQNGESEFFSAMGGEFTRSWSGWITEGRRRVARCLRR
jgi:hypothetical protein